MVCFDKQKDYLLPFWFVCILLVFWEISVALGWIKSSFFPAPSMVLSGLWELARTGKLFDHVVASLFRVTWGYLLGVILAIPFGICLGLSTCMRRMFNPLIQFFRPVSPLAWIPISLLLFGIGDVPAIFLIFLAVFFPMVVFTTASIAGVKKIYWNAAFNFGLTGMEFYTKVLLPAAFPEMLVGLRITLGTAWLVIVAAEMIAVKSGLGYLIVDARNSMRMDQVLGGMFVIGVIGMGLDYCVRLIERSPVVKWKIARK